MEVIYSTKAKEDFSYWKKNNSKMIERINKLIADIKLNPFKGLGKPEPLKFVKVGYWSRRIDQEHRLVYKISDDIIYIVQCRYHY
jgi:toxin YoeB